MKVAGTGTLSNFPAGDTKDRHHEILQPEICHEADIVVIEAFLHFPGLSSGNNSKRTLKVCLLAFRGFSLKSLRQEITCTKLPQL